MQESSSHGICLLLATIALSATHGAEMEESSDFKTNSVAELPHVQVEVYQKPKDTLMPYRYAFITCGQNKFTFLIPDDYRVDCSHPNTIKLISKDRSCYLQLDFRPGQFASSLESMSDRITTKNFGAQVGEINSMSADGQLVQALDCEWDIGSGVKGKSRTAFMSVPGGSVEFSITTSLNHFDLALSQLSLVIQTFRSSASGKFEYIRGSDRP